MSRLCQAQPMQGPGHGLDHGSIGLGWTLDHDHPAAQAACGFQLGVSPRATRVFGNEVGDAMATHQGVIIFDGERAARDHDNALSCGQRRPRIDHAQQPPVVRTRLQKWLNVLAADGQKNARRLPRQRSHRSGDVGYRLPPVVRLAGPRGALQREQGDTGRRAGLCGVPAHLRSEGVGGIDHVCDALRAQVFAQAHHPAEAAYAGGQGLWQRLCGTASVREHGRHLRCCQGACQLAGFAGATQQKDTGRDG